jgi:hypothetical protein
VSENLDFLIALDGENAEAVGANFDPATFQNDLEAEIMEIINRASLEMLEVARPLCPVRTGVLIASLEPLTEEDGASIISNVEYFPYVEFGTKNMTGFHMAEIAVETVEPSMLAEINAAVAEAVNV